jgi:hypothetical protein
MTLRNPFPFFSLIPLAQRKEPKEMPFEEFRLCGADEGFAPSTCANF